MRKYLSLPVILVLTGMLTAFDETPPLVDFHGDWNGSGTMLGRDVAVNLSWTPTLAGRFTKLQIAYRSLDEEQPFHFEGVAYYRAGDDADFTGTWFDSQGNVHPLTAVIRDQELTASWGTPATELGQSVYRILEDSRLQVIDSVQAESGEWNEFARATLSRN